MVSEKMEEKVESEKHEADRNVLRASEWQRVDAKHGHLKDEYGKLLLVVNEIELDDVVPEALLEGVLEHVQFVAKVEQHKCAQCANYLAGDGGRRRRHRYHLIRVRFRSGVGQDQVEETVTKE